MGERAEHSTASAGNPTRRICYLSTGASDSIARCLAAKLGGAVTAVDDKTRCPNLRCRIVLADVPDTPIGREAFCPKCKANLMWGGLHWIFTGSFALDWVKKEKHGGLF